MQERNRRLSMGLLLGAVLAGGPAAAEVECGDVIGPGEAVVLQSNVGPCTPDDAPNGCALTLRGNSFLVGNGHKISCAPNPCIAGLPHGLCVRGRDSWVRDLRIRNCNRGVLVRGADHELTLIDSRRNSLGGELEGRRATVSESTFNNNTSDGLRVEGRSNVVYESVFNNNGDDGVEVRGRFQELSHFTANNNGDNGVELRTDGSSILRGEARSNEGTGIDDEDTDGDIEINLIQYNDASRNGYHGIHIGRTTESTVDSNAANDNGRSGIRVFNGQISAAVITNNTALGNNPCVPLAEADLRDDNPDCGGNTWAGNTFETSIVDGGVGPQDCIE